MLSGGLGFKYFIRQYIKLIKFKKYLSFPTYLAFSHFSETLFSVKLYSVHMAWLRIINAYGSCQQPFDTLQSFIRHVRFGAYFASSSSSSSLLFTFQARQHSHEIHQLASSCPFVLPSVHRSVHLSVSPHITARLPLHGFSCNLMLGTFTKICG